MRVDEWTMGDGSTVRLERETAHSYRLTHDGAVVFEGGDFEPSPLDAEDSDAATGALLGFLSLRPGDTDAEYFAQYTPAQLTFADLYGEELSLTVAELEGWDAD